MARVVGWPSNGKNLAALLSSNQIVAGTAQAQFANSFRLSWAVRSTLRLLPADCNANWKFPLTGFAELSGTQRFTKPELEIDLPNWPNAKHSMRLPLMSAPIAPPRAAG